MAEAFIGLGGNIGDVRTTFQRAIVTVCGMTQGALIARSSDYLTPPLGGPPQAPFVNACFAIDTPLDPHALMFTLHKIEKKFGRDRAREERWGPRTLDLDLLAYEDVILDNAGLKLPHPAMFERAFVLVPLAEIAPDRAISGQTPAQALARISTDGILRLAELAATD